MVNFYKNLLRYFFYYPYAILFFLFLVNTKITVAQKYPVQKNNASTANAVVKFSSHNTSDLFGIQSSFIKNVGQYGNTLPGHEEMGEILFGYEGLGMPILFTQKGLIHLQRKIEGPSEKEKEENERRQKKGKHAEVEIEEQKAIDRTITMEWLNVNPDVQVIAEDKTQAYHTYASMQSKAYGYRKITYKNLYHGIDLVYSFNLNKKFGFEYSLIVQPGADVSVLKMKFGGDVKSIKQNAEGKLIIKSDIDGIEESVPVSFYGDNINFKSAPQKITAGFLLHDKEVSFSVAENYDHTKSLVIDPFVTSTSNLSGLNTGKAKDVDYDYAGNVYVTGGGNSTVHQLAKFNAAGVLQWTFSGALTIPSWSFGTYWGGWMVEKPTGNIYLGQGFNPVTGFQVIRVSTFGLYDNFITNANPNFREAWKLLWNCNNGSPQILVAGGGTNSNINFGVFTPPSTVVGSLNVTGIPYTVSAGWAQDIVDFIIDPANNDMYTIYGSSFGNPSLTNKIYKNTQPYSGASVVWNVPSGFTSVQEIANRPYLLGGQIDNSANIFAINGSYLYYWDGKNLKAFNKATGAGVGTPLTTANTTLIQGGIIADACNNIFVGDGNGVIKVYNFNGAVFSDAPADIVIPGFNGRAVYDLAYDESKKLLYASGDGFVASFDVSAYCPTSQYTLTVVPNCLTASATVTISPAPPVGSTITYILSAGGVQIATNTTGIFTGLTPNVTYTVVATINQACSGSQATTTFVLPGPTITVSSTNTTCGNSTGTITATGSVTTGPYTYSIDGITFFSSGNFTGLTAGVYTVTVKDANGCATKTIVTILNSNGPALTFTITNADCGNNNGTVTANVTGGVAPYQYSINGTTFQTSNFFTGLVGGTYTLTVKDAAGCTNAAIVTITSAPKPLLSAIPATATCNGNSGSITAFGSGGTGALQYSINGNIFQVSNVFTNLTPGSYTVYVKDANGCTNNVTVIIANSPAPNVIATSTPAACNNVNGTITATGTGGVAPLQYSLNGGAFQSSNIFTGLAAATYTISVKDATGCTNNTTVIIGTIGGPSVTATASVSACNTNNGTVTAVASGGTSPYTYSVDGVVFQASNIFNGLGAGSYILYVRDASGCVGTTRITVVNASGLSLTVSSTIPTCGATNGTITATATGGVAPLQYSINGVTYQAGNVFTSIAAGAYTVYVKDATGCIVTRIINVPNPSNLTLTANVPQQATCGTASGVIVANGTGGIAPLQYSINGTTFQSSNIFIGVAPGTYTITVKDASGCIATQVVTVTNSGTGGAITDVTFTIQDALACTGHLGKIKNLKAVPNGGGNVYQFSLDGGAFQTGNQFINVSVGTHFITAKNVGSAGTGQCTISKIAVIGNGVPATATATSTASACGAATGTITIVGVGANVPYHASIDGGATWNTFFPPGVNSFTFTGLAPGTYNIIIADDGDFKAGPPIVAGACLTTISVVVPSTGGPSLSTTQINGSCGTNTGSISATGSGGTAPYTYSIDGGAYVASGVFNNLAPGPHAVSVKDATGCTNGVIVILINAGGPTVTAVVQSTSCNTNNGTITATAIGGTAPLQYSINGTTFQSSNIFTGLAPGNYTVYAGDGSGCFGTVNVIIINTPLPKVTAFIIAATCNNNDGSIVAEGSQGEAPYTFSIDGITYQSSTTFNNLAAGFYTVYIKDARGCITTSGISVTNSAAPIITNTITTSANCNTATGALTITASGGVAPLQYSIDGITFQSSNVFFSLLPGNYTATVKDANGCLSTKTIVIGNNSGPQVLTAIVINAACGLANGTITATASGGTAPLQYSIDGSTYQASNIFTNIAAGSYTLFVKDANGCIKTLVPVVVTNLPTPTLTATSSPTSCGTNDGTITAIATGGTLPLTYSKDGITFQSSNIFLGLAAAPYTITVKDARGCVATFVITVAVAGTSNTPTFNPVAPICAGATLTSLPTTSLNGIVGTWSPALNNTVTTVYTFTPNAGQCATTTTLTITVNPKPTPILIYHN